MLFLETLKANEQKGVKQEFTIRVWVRILSTKLRPTDHGLIKPKSISRWHCFHLNSNPRCEEEASNRIGLKFLCQITFGHCAGLPEHLSRGEYGLVSWPT
jgi:hypothetical protein